ncbi:MULTISPECIES: SRPBCC family protein [Paenibacillus]|uniref:SRPBCC family protein n=1 Tax=Paenibacillus TaxID=44249 RepID=UPI0022B8D65B|nr:SRPBCC family protein [Paenibacillus caseinilyticus]MCZ8521806.1 SRPBCC family protein [Paenibacillus caseinilyticus]
MITTSTETVFNAGVEACFDAARNIEIHTQTVWKHTRERAVAGRTTGMIGAGETVTFEAVHFGIRQRLTSRVVEFVRPVRFVDEMISGAFRSMRHEHEFIPLGAGGTIMRDTLIFAAPFGPAGWIAERLVLQGYMTRFLEYRNRQLKLRLEAQ